MNYLNRKEIGEIAKLSERAIRSRSELLEIFPDYILKGKYYYCQEKANAIIAYVKFNPRANYLIFESKMNYEN
jgi:hypothetical protein